MPLSSWRSRVPIPPAAPVTKTVCMMCPSRLESETFQLAAAELGGEALVALADADELPAQRRARLQNGAAADRLHDGALLALEGFAGCALGDAGPAANRLSRDDEASEMFQKAPELRVSGGVRDAAMEREILRDRVFAALERGADGVEALDDPADLRRRAAIGGQPRGFDLDAGAQLHHVEDRAQRRQRIDVDAQRPARVLRNEGADALTRDHESIRAQGRHRLAHHGAAHAGRRDRFLFGGQLRSRPAPAACDIVC